MTAEMTMDGHYDHISSFTRCVAALVGGARVGPLDVMFSHLAIERCRLDPEQRGGAVRSVDSAAAALDGVDNRLALTVRQARRHIHGGWTFQPGWIDIQGVTGADDHRPLNDIFQFADVARPGIIH